MIATKEAFEATNELFKRIIPLKNFQKEIIVIDKNNEHKNSIINLLKNDFYPYLKENINVSFMDADNIDFNIKNKIICVPIAFNKVNIKKWITLGNNNLVIAAKDEEYQYPWCINNTICANYPIHWAMNIHNKDTGITGTSAYCAFLSILALNGRNFVLHYIKKVNTNVKSNTKEIFTR